MKLRSPWLIRGVAHGAAALIRTWLATMRTLKTSWDAIEHPVDPLSRRCIYCFWHEGMLGPLKIRAPMSVLISQHADGELIAQVCERLGFGTVRGSTTRGGCEAMLSMVRGEQGATHLVITPDGPRGPRRELQAGAVLVASLTGLPVVPIGVGFTSAWRFTSWDRFALPRPFSTCVGVIGEPIQVPAKLDRAGINTWQARVQRALDEAQLAAEDWAARVKKEGRHAAPPAKPTAATEPPAAAKSAA